MGLLSAPPKLHGPTQSIMIARRFQPSKGKTLAQKLVPTPSRRFLLPILLSLIPFAAQANEEKPIVNLASPETVQQFAPSDGQVSAALGEAAAPGIVVTIQPGNSPFPGLALKSPGGVYDLSSFGYVEAQVANPNAQPLGINMRIDNTGEHGSYWLSESSKIPPGETRTLRAYLSKPVDGFRSDRISQILFFTGKVDGAPSSFRIGSIVAGGNPGDRGPVNPADIRVRPEEGVLYAAGTPVDPSQLAGKGNGGMSFQDGTLRAALPATASPDAVSLFRPPAGAWDLRDQLEVHVVLKNTGADPVTPQVRLDSLFGPTDTIAAPAPLAPGAEVEIVVPFIALTPWKGTAQDIAEKPSAKNMVEGSGNSFASNSTLDVAISALPLDKDRSLTVTSIRAAVPPTPETPDWLGKRPPVEGDWVQTFDDEFDGTALDASKWTSTGDNYYDKVSHYSQDNVIVGGGVARIRYEKKTGRHNDSPTGYQTDYATGYLDTFDKWAQRYGYFECRMKLPKAPGLWPAFWMMPDRPGPERKGVRGSTADGGMEFDILEWLSIWGPYRYNVAMHWDGYGPDHKSTGSKIYFQPDKDGFVTAGLLWTPGSAVFYANGREVLRFESPRIASVPEMIMFTLPVGGWDNNHLDPQNLQLPDDLVIDYVRAWQRRDLGSDADTVKTAADSK